MPSQFSAPVPGEGLAHPPGSFPWERPPQYVDPQEAVNFIWKTLVKPDRLPKMLALLESGATVADITKGTLVSGFQQGLWSIDVMMLIDQNVFLMVATLAEKAGIKYKLIPDGGPSGVDTFMQELNTNLIKAKMGGTPDDVAAAFDDAEQGGNVMPGMGQSAPPDPAAALAPQGNGLFTPPGQ